MIGASVPLLLARIPVGRFTGLVGSAGPTLLISDATFAVNAVAPAELEKTKAAACPNGLPLTLITVPAAVLTVADPMPSTHARMPRGRNPLTSSVPLLYVTDALPAPLTPVNVGSPA